MEQKKRLIIIDSNSLIHRAYHALPPLKTKKGELVNAIYGFLLIFLKALKELHPDFVIATFDLPGPTFRHKKYKKYKAKRPPAPEELYQQISKVKRILGAFGVPVFEKQGFEADDIIGAIASSAPKKQIFPKLETIILSGDLDTLQLVNPQTKVYTMRKGIKDTVLYDVERAKQRYQGLTPSQLTDFKALKGDPSDNIPGVPGIGEKTAIQLIKNFGSLENLYSTLNQRPLPKAVLINVNQRLRAKLEEHKEQAFLSKKLSQIRKDIPLDFRLKDSQFGKYNLRKIAEIFKNLEFYTLLKRLEEVKNQFGQKSLTIAGEKWQKEEIEEEIEKLYREGVFSKKIAQVEKELVPVVKEMEENGIRINLEGLNELSKNLEAKIKNLEEKIYNIAGIEFNINSPQQLSEILFKKLKIPTAGLRKTPGGVISTGAEELEKLKDIHPIINLILKYRELFKLKSGFIDALPKMAEPKDGRIHPNFHQLGTETGRMSCSEPNLQNIPIKGEIGKKIRKCFIPETGFKLLSADYSQMELRIAASLSKDKKMIDYFKKAEDIHKLTASDIFKVEKEKVTQKMREVAKSLNFGILYGMGPRSFSGRTGISFSDSKKFIKKYFENFKGIGEYVEDSLKMARKLGYAETLFGRKRFLPEINSIDQRLRTQAERMALNAPIQGSSADIVKMAMAEIAEQGITNDKCKMILQIHDELLFEIAEDKVKEIAPKIEKIMENIVNLKSPLRVEIKTGDSWGSLRTMVK